MTEGDVMKWLKNEGDYVQKGEPLAEIETSKTISELYAPVSGLLTKIVVPGGETALVQSVVAIIEEA